MEEVSQKVTRSHVGIGHTRWATCGPKVTRNAHPHYSEDKLTYIVHNGIIGGHSKIKKNYLSDITFNSETDSEVVAQLIGKFKKQGKSLMEALIESEKIMKENSKKSQWGVVMIDRDEPDKIWTSTNGSPILIGMNDDEMFVASEQIAFQREADCYFSTQDG